MTLNLQWIALQAEIDQVCAEWEEMRETFEDAA